MRLPNDIAIVRARQGSHRVVFVSDDLNHDQELAARVLVTVLAAGQPYMLLMKTDILAALIAAA